MVKKRVLTKKKKFLQKKYFHKKNVFCPKNMFFIKKKIYIFSPKDMFSSQFSKMVPNALKLPNIFQNLSKQFKMVKNGPKGSKRIIKKCPKLFKIVQNSLT